MIDNPEHCFRSVIGKSAQGGQVPLKTTLFSASDNTPTDPPTTEQWSRQKAHELIDDHGHGYFSPSLSSCEDVLAIADHLLMIAHTSPHAAIAVLRQTLILGHFCDPHLKSILTRSFILGLTTEQMKKITPTMLHNVLRLVADETSIPLTTSTTQRHSTRHSTRRPT